MSRDRLYFVAVEEVYGNSSKVIVDSEGSGNLMYLPLDKLMNQGTRSDAGAESNRAADSQSPQTQPAALPQEDGSRDRRVRQ